MLSSGFAHKKSSLLKLVLEGTDSKNSMLVCLSFSLVHASNRLSSFSSMDFQSCLIMLCFKRLSLPLLHPM